jgi:RHS repeat-associated protein
VDHYGLDHLGNARIVYGNNGGWDQSDFYPFGGERVITSQVGSRYKFTGKERDSESGLDNFGARYDSSQYGRFMTPDWSAKPMGVPYADFGGPQSLNLYAYVRNNPLSRVDRDGHYEENASGCGDNAKCQKRWDKAADKFAARREKNLSSKKADVRAAAAAYGARGEANGVHVGFANLNTGPNPTYGSVDASGSQPGLQPLVQVTLDFGRAGNSETITHEGTHVGDDMNFLDSGYNPMLNLTHGQTEFNAFRAGAEVNQEHGFGPNDTQKILNFLHSSPIYGPIFNVPVFDPNKFRTGVPDDEQQ